MTVWIVVGLLILVAMFSIVVYNKLVTLKNRFRNGFAQIDVQLQRRHDLIPNLVETAKAYLSHEQNTLVQLSEARSSAVAAKQQAKQNPENPGTMNLLSQAENMLTQALGRFYAVAENYPDLKANDIIVNLMEELSSTENRIGFARQAYNDFVLDYNTYREQFPVNLVVVAFPSFKEAAAFEVENSDVRQAVKVQF